MNISIFSIVLLFGILLYIPYSKRRQRKYYESIRDGTLTMSFSNYEDEKRFIKEVSDYFKKNGKEEILCEYPASEPISEEEYMEYEKWLNS